MVCDRCGHCLDRSSGAIVDSILCPGCPRRPVCESRPTIDVLDTTTLVVLDDGAVVGIRVLVPGDRDVLAEAYEELSERSRRLRFFSPPKHLSPALLSYLTTLDYWNQFALVAFVAETQEGIGLARWSRDRDQPSQAEAAIVVVDAWQRRGLGSALLRALVDEARQRAVEVFTAEVLWENKAILEPAQERGAVVTPVEPGVAKVAFDLSETQPADRSAALGRFFRDVAAT